MGAGAAVSVAAQTDGLLCRREAITCAGGERQNDFAAVAVEQRMQFAEQIEIEIQDLNFWIIGREGELIGTRDVGVGENENGILAVGGLAEQRVNGRVGRAQARELGAVKKARMVGDELVELREFGNDVVGRAPVQAGVAVDADFFRRQPFHAAGKAETAARTCQGAEAVSQQRPRAAMGSGE